MAMAPINNVISLPVRQELDHPNAGHNEVQDDFSVSRRRSHKKDVEVGRKLVKKMPVLEFNEANYPSEYSSWKNSKHRCKKGQGEFDSRFEQFSGFMGIMGAKPSKDCTLDRIDNTNPDYSPENCRWATKLQQTRNRGITHMLTDNTGKAQTAMEWASRLGSVSANTMLQRVYRGWSYHEAIHLPKGVGRKKPHQISSKSAQLPSANCDELVTLIEQKLREVHQQGFICTLPKHKKMLKDISRHLEAGGIPTLPALALVLDEWSEFKKYAYKTYGLFNLPEVPTTEYLFRALQAIGNYYLRHLQNIEEESVNEQQQILLEEQESLKAQQRERRKKFIEEHLNANPEYKRLNDRLTWLGSVKHQPNCGMEREHYIEYAPIWFFLNSHTDRTAQQESPEQWAEHAMAETTQRWPKRIWQQLGIEAEDKLQTLLREKGLQKQAEEAYDNA